MLIKKVREYFMKDLRNSILYYLTILILLLTLILLFNSVLWYNNYKSKSI